MKSKSWVSVLLVCCIFITGSENATGQTLTDREFFDVLNLDYPGLEQVKANVRKNDVTKAKKEYVKYLKNRTTPKWYVDWRDYSSQKGKYSVRDYIIPNSDRYAKNELYAHEAWYQYGNKIEWTVDHSNDHYDEWVWQLNRHHCWVEMSQAYWATGDEKYAKAFVRQINGWIDQCKIPSFYQGRGSVWRTLDAGLRMRDNWPNILYRFLPSPSFDDETVVKMIKSIYQHAIHLRNNNTANNWLAVEMNGLYVVGGLFPEFKEAEEWCSFAVQKLYEQEKELFYPDGAEIELTPNYHELSASSIVAVYQFAQLNGYQLPSDFVARLEKIYEVFVKLRMPDGRMPAINDSDWIHTTASLRTASSLFPDRMDFKYFITDGKEGKEPNYKSVWMPWAGWYVMRSGWDKDAFYSFFEVGPLGSAHQHEDKLSFILYAFGKRLITETGYYAYDTSKWRNYTFSARGHNVARVDGNDQNRLLKRDSESIKLSRRPLNNTWVSNSRYDYGEGYYTDGYGANYDTTVTHHRTLQFVKDKLWVVKDTFIPSDDKKHSYETWFHFSTPNYGINEHNSIVYSEAPNSPNIAIVALSGNSSIKVIIGQESPDIQGWIPVLGGANGFHCEPIATPTYYISGKGKVSETYLFIPYEADTPMPIDKVKRITRRKYRIYLNNGDKFTVSVR